MGAGLKVGLVLRNGCKVSKLASIATFGALSPRTNSLGSQLPLTSDLCKVLALLPPWPQLCTSLGKESVVV